MSNWPHLQIFFKYFWVLFGSCTKQFISHWFCLCCIWSGVKTSCPSFYLLTSYCGPFWGHTRSSPGDIVPVLLLTFSCRLCLPGTLTHARYKRWQVKVKAGLQQCNHTIPQTPPNRHFLWHLWQMAQDNIMFYPSHDISQLAVWYHASTAHLHEFSGKFGWVQIQYWKNKWELIINWIVLCNWLYQLLSTMTFVARMPSTV